MQASPAQRARSVAGRSRLKPLWLAELTCRNRQPAAVDPDAATHCADGADAPVHNQDIQHFPFDRQKYPCAGTTTPSAWRCAPRCSTRWPPKAPCSARARGRQRL
jgi:hypothetical protein